MKTQHARPSSTIPPLTGYLGLLTIIILSLVFPSLPFQRWSLSLTEITVLFALIVFAVMAIYEFVFVKSYKSVEAGIDFKQKIDFKQRFNVDFAVKIFGLAATLGLVASYYSVADLYQGSWYNPYFNFLYDYRWLISGLVLAYFAFVQMFMKEPNDAYWHVGRFVLTFGREGDRSLIRDHFLAMAVKTFFLPIMFCSVVYDMQRLGGTDFNELKLFSDYYGLIFGYLMFIDVLYTIIGYVFSSRLLNAHIRWTERTAGGWIFCLVCYMPFWQMFGRNFLDYHDSGAVWSLAEMFPAVNVVWLSVILLLMVIYTLSTVHFGLRFSNLTYRGTITHGTYSFTKHPAYISKNLSWWMISMPFMAIDWTLAVRNCVALLGVNYIYYRRAKYEEQCLSEAPEYRDYMEYMKENGLFSKHNLYRFLPFLKKKQKN